MLFSIIEYTVMLLNIVATFLSAALWTSVQLHAVLSNIVVFLVSVQFKTSWKIVDRIELIICLYQVIDEKTLVIPKQYSNCDSSYK